MPKTILANKWALMPLIVFLSVYLLGSIWINDFYKIPIVIAFILAAIVAIMMSKGSFQERIDRFSKGAANPNIMLMVWIFLLAGAFASTAKAMGAIDETVNLALSILPSNLLLSGLFAAACFISLSIGTSVGTIVALTPVAIGIAPEIGIEAAYMVAIVMGGAFFGDNLSFISDTTIAATRTQDCQMQDKFKVNSKIVAPVALLVFAIYVFKGQSIELTHVVEQVEWIKVLPYLLVLGTAIAGVHVILVLLLGIFSAASIGFFTHAFDLFSWLEAMKNGVIGMGELTFITLLAGGTLEMIRINGGIQYVIEKLTKHVNGRIGAEMSIAGLVCFANLCTANNTIAVISVGPIARDIATQFNIDPRKSASLLDTFSCFIQGIIPYGAQMLIAASLANLSPLSIIEHLYYPFLMGIAALLAILFKYPRNLAR